MTWDIYRYASWISINLFEANSKNSWSKPKEEIESGWNFLDRLLYLSIRMLWVGRESKPNIFRYFSRTGSTFPYSFPLLVLFISKAFTHPPSSFFTYKTAFFAMPLFQWMPKSISLKPSGEPSYQMDSSL